MCVIQLCAHDNIRSVHMHDSVCMSLRLMASIPKYIKREIFYVRKRSGRGEGSITSANKISIESHFADALANKFLLRFMGVGWWLPLISSSECDELAERFHFGGGE